MGIENATFLDWVFLVGSFICVIAICYLGRHILPQGMIMMSKDLWRLKIIMVRVLRNQIQKNDSSDNPEAKKNLTDYNHNSNLTNKNKQDRK